MLQLSGLPGRKASVSILVRGCPVSRSVAIVSWLSVDFTGPATQVVNTGSLMPKNSGNIPGVVKSRVCSALILFLLCVFIITQSPISNTAQVLAFSKAPMGAGSPCPSPGAADFSNQLIPPSTTTASLPGHVVQPVLQGGAQLVRPLNPNLQLHLAFVFAIRNPTQFQDCLNAISDPSSPQ